MSERPRNGILVTVDYGKVDVVILQVWTEGGIANVHMTGDETRRLARRLIGAADTVEPASGNDPIGSVFVVGDMRQKKPEAA